MTLQEKLAGLTYPCYLVAHGPAREHRTRYRSEHAGAFRSGMVASVTEAMALVNSTAYLGLDSEMDLIAISVQEGELCETVL